VSRHLILGIDATIERRRDRKIAARGVYRDPVRTSKEFFMKTNGLRWISLMLLTPIPWVQRVWTLPFLTVLTPSERSHEERHLQHKTSTEWAWQMLLQVVRRMSGRNQFRIAPRPISDDLWAKLLWAGLNLHAEDFLIQGHHRHRPEDQEAEPLQSGQEAGSFYPLEMLRALAVVWLFAGLRSDELSRLRVGCARQQTVVTGEQLEEKPVCLLDIPVHKTGRAFTKPVDSLVGEAIAAWEAVRPAQPDLIDPKTSEQVQFLFCDRAKRLSKGYLNKTLIPALCQQAGIPRAAARGSISSHRARSTIASQLFNAREPMTLFELQAWLGHQSPATTQHYVLTSPTKLAQAYKDAGYFSRNVRAIEVFIDQNAITSGAAASGTPWRYYDLGHGWCSYEFFDQCPHRMACTRCDFYVPKESDRGLWLQTCDGLLKLLQEIPLSDEERAAVDGDVQALDRLLDQLPAERCPDSRSGFFTKAAPVYSTPYHTFCSTRTVRRENQ